MIQGYNYGKVAKHRFLIRRIALVAFVLICAFIWYMTSKDNSWKETEKETQEEEVVKESKTDKTSESTYDASNN